jgi:carboxyl-terminal processing protease
VSEFYGITEEDIGRYRGMNAVVLCHESTASAAELFVANFRDHNLGEIVGTTTYGKGSVQTYINTIEVNGKKVYLDGVLKLTVYKYFPPCGEGYDGIGIEPKDECKVELSEEAKNKNIYDTMGTVEDNQLTEALKHLK